MRNLLLLSFILAGPLTFASQQPPAPATTQPAPAASKPAPATSKPPAAKPATSNRTAATPAPAARSGLALRVTDRGGAPLTGVLVELTGPTPRMMETSNGEANFTLLQAGTYLLKFSGPTVTTFEREVVLASGKPTPLDIMLSPAPAPREVVREIAPAAPAPTPPVVGPVGTPQLTSLYDIAEKEIRQKSPRKEILVACSGNLRSMIVTLDKDEQPKRKYDDAEASYYVLGGEAGFRIADKETVLPSGGYAAVPRGVPFAISNRGKKPLFLLALLSGAPCEEAR